jgi:hypothetical protein
VERLVGEGSGSCSGNGVEVDLILQETLVECLDRVIDSLTSGN